MSIFHTIRLIARGSLYPNPRGIPRAVSLGSVKTDHTNKIGRLRSPHTSKNDLEQRSCVREIGKQREVNGLDVY